MDVYIFISIQICGQHQLLKKLIQHQLSKDAYHQVQLLQAELGTNAGGSPGDGGRDWL